jgi:hypothetical protein
VSLAPQVIEWIHQHQTWPPAAVFVLAFGESLAMIADIAGDGDPAGSFFGPLRSVVPLVAGVCGMPQLAFQLANVASAVVWATLILAPGVLGLRWLL